MTTTQFAQKTCKCGKRIVWAKTPEGKVVPLDPVAPTYDVRLNLMGDQTAERSSAYVSHFATCPNANDFSGKGRRP